MKPPKFPSNLLPGEIKIKWVELNLEEDWADVWRISWEENRICFSFYTWLPRNEELDCFGEWSCDPTCGASLSLETIQAIAHSDYLTCKYHKDVSYDKKYKCPQCQEKEISNLKNRLSSYQEAWFEQRETTGKSFWMLPYIDRLMYQQWSPSFVSTLHKYKGCLGLIESLLNGFFQLVTLPTKEDHE